MIDYLPPKVEDYSDKMNKMFPDKKCREITLQLTEDCCMACTYCYQHHKTSKKMTFEQAKSLIDKVFDGFYGITKENTSAIVLDFIGGEPLMEIDLIRQITDYTVDKMIAENHPWLPYFRVSICSNGLLYFDHRFQDYLNRYMDIIDYTVSIDGNKELHDSCRLDLKGAGTYDRAIAAVKHFDKLVGLHPSTKMTLAPENVSYIYDAIVNLINEEYTTINMNCIFEEGWELPHAKILYEQLKKVADYMVDNELYNKVFISIFDEAYFVPQNPENLTNWCGGAGDEADVNLSVNSSGDIYPCIRYMESSLNGKQKPLPIGNIEHGYLATEEEKANHKILTAVDRKSQSTAKCFYCPIGAGCAHCSALNYELFGTPNRKATFICVMHQARALANAYFWSRVYKAAGVDKKWELCIPRRWALKIIDKNEYKTLRKECNVLCWKTKLKNFALRLKMKIWRTLSGSSIR